MSSKSVFEDYEKRQVEGVYQTIFPKPAVDGYFGTKYFYDFNEEKKDNKEQVIVDENITDLEMEIQDALLEIVIFLF